MKRNGLRTSIRELKEKAHDLEFDCKDENQVFEIPILNPDDVADGWIFEQSAS